MLLQLFLDRHLHRRLHRRLLSRSALEGSGRWSGHLRVDGHCLVCWEFRTLQSMPKVHHASTLIIHRRFQLLNCCLITQCQIFTLLNLLQVLVVEFVVL